MFYIIGILAGFIFALQVPVNARLGKALGSPFISSAISFAVGAIALLAVSFATVGDFFGNFSNVLSLNESPIIWIAGIFGGIYLTSNILLFSRIGAILTVVLPTLGMILSSTAIETFGWLYVKQIPMTTSRVIGVVVLLIGIFVAVVLSNGVKKTEKTVENIEQDEGKGEFILWAIWGIVIGGLSSVQQALTGHLGTLLKSPVQATFVSFLGGFLTILIVTLIRDRSTLKNMFTKAKEQPAPKWSWIGGFFGAFYVYTLALLIPIFGPGLTISLGVTGTILGAAVVQQFGWFHSQKKQVTLPQIIGIIIMGIGILIIKQIIHL